MNIWPGFVDGLATILLVVIFVLLVFLAGQFFLSLRLSGREAQLERLNSQIDELAELLETEQLESKHAKLDLQPVEPKQLIESVIQQHFAQAKLITRYQGTSQSIELDAVRIKLLIKNLLDNALRHTPETAQPVDICSDLSPREWRLSVQDHGEGIPAEHLAHLTEPFYRVDKARQRETGGYGLGLYLCRVIAEAHGGDVVVESTPGQGATFRLWIPVTPSR